MASGGDRYHLITNARRNPSLRARKNFSGPPFCLTGKIGGVGMGHVRARRRGRRTSLPTTPGPAMPMPRRQTTEQLLRHFLLLAVQDGADRYFFRVIDRSSCELIAWVCGEKLELVPPFMDDLQLLPAELARLETPVFRCWHGLTRWFHRARSGVQSGRFRYPIGTGVVRVEYRVRWRDWAVVELEVIVGTASELGDAARARLAELNPPHGEEVFYEE